MAFRQFLGGLAASLLLAASVLAGEAADTPFTEGAHAFSLTSGCTFERHDSDIYLANLNTEYAYYFHDYVAIAGQVPIYYGYNDEAAIGGGFNALARWHFLNIGRFSMYGDILGGVLQTDANFPEGGTHFNFTYQAGAGMTFRIYESLHLMGGARFQHVSNAFIEGRDRNPVYNSYGGYVGLMWAF